MRSKIIAALLFLLLSPVVCARETTAETKGASFFSAHISRITHQCVYDAKQFGMTFKNTVAAPVRWKPTDWLTAGAIGGLTTYLYQDKKNDRKWFRFSRLNQKYGEYEVYPKTFFEKTYMRLLEYPISHISFGIAGATVLGNIFDLLPLHHLSAELLQSIAMSTGLATFGNFILAERRPSEGGKMRYFSRNGHGISGHGTFYTSLSGPLNKYISRFDEDDSTLMLISKSFAKTLIYGIPLLLAYSRLRHESSLNYPSKQAHPSHHAWNVLLALSLGYATGEFVALQNRW